MKKAETIERYGKEAYKKQLAQQQLWRKRNPKQVVALSRKHREENGERVEAANHENGRKGGKYYTKHLKYEHTGLPGERNRIRSKDSTRWAAYKRIIAPDSQLHHQWRPGTAEYDGIALVEADKHMHGFIDVIEILKGEITLLSEEEIRRRG